ncbi:ATP synthase subunit delta [Alicyclobacillus contaminans]|uniref:ATP synthase F1 subunit delta n=1 Tax=Alicyclobacillus contaminans TaxID=392016 RepID=UPI00040E0939|nr:ATP synthase F1 subunit delta [Alicyclobacillus contaminans]GMA50932.1 ATP synthase subunit delta [Alicyclobacillus contaminans]
MSGAVARRYTAGLFAYAEAHGLVDAVDQGLQLIADSLREHPELTALLEHPVIRADRKQALFRQVFANLVDPVVVRFVQLLIRRGRGSELLAVQAAFHAQAQAARGIVDVTVESAFPMTEAQVDELTRQLSQALGKTVHVQVAVRPELVAGCRVQMGHRMLDASVQGALRQFRGRLLRHGAVQA